MHRCMRYRLGRRVFVQFNEVSKCNTFGRSTYIQSSKLLRVKSHILVRYRRNRTYMSFIESALNRLLNHRTLFTVNAICCPIDVRYGIAKQPRLQRVTKHGQVRNPNPGVHHAYSHLTVNPTVRLSSTHQKSRVTKVKH